MKEIIFKKKEYYNLFTVLVVIYLGNISICVWKSARLRITEGKNDATTIIQFPSFLVL